MKITVIGTGYVGLVTGTCFADMGNDVICIDKDKNKIEMLKQGQIPIWEPGLEQLVRRNFQEGRLSFTTNIKEAVDKSFICMIAVGTPPDEDGSADLTHVLKVAKDIASCMQEYKIIINKSTVPIGTADKVKDEIQKVLDERGVDFKFDVVSNPEFLKEGAAIEDFMKPERVIVGVENEKVAKIMKELYSPFSRTHEKLILMSVRSAEMTKYAANAMLATKISFINDIANLCELLGADVSEVRHGIGSDSRIGYKFIYPGIGYGGSCFPKDVKALIEIGKKENKDLRVLQAVEAVNDDQKTVLLKKVLKHFGNDLSGKTFAIWGLSFKPQTDDMREAPSIIIINGLIKAGAKIQAYDPVAMNEAKKVFGENSQIKYFEGNYEALKDANALLLLTEWHQFRYPDFSKIKKILKDKIFINLKWLMFAEFWVRVFGILGAIYLARTLSKGSFGKWSYAYAFLQYLMILSDYGINSRLGVREVAKDVNKINFYFANFFSIRFLISLFSFLIFSFVFALFYKGFMQKFLILTIVAVIPYSLIQEWVFRGLEKMEYITLGRFFQGFTFLLFIYLLVKSDKDIFYIPLGRLVSLSVVSFIFVFLFYRMGLFQNFLKNIDINFLRSILKVGFILVLSSLMVKVYYNVDTIMMGIFRSMEEVGVYSALYNFVLGLVSIRNVILGAVFPTLSRVKILPKKVFIRKIVFIEILSSSLGLIAFLVAIFFNKFWINLIYGSKYISDLSLKVFNILMVTPLIIFIDLVFPSLLITAEYEKYYFLITSIGAGLNFILNLFFIPRYGMVGAAITTLLSELWVLFASLYFNIKLGIIK